MYANLDSAVMSGESQMAYTSHSYEILSHYKVIRRGGQVVEFSPAKIMVALSKAFIAVHGSGAGASASVREQVAALTDSVVAALIRRKPEGGAIHIEDIQDQVELALMRSGEHDVARAYVLYRESRSKERAAQQEPEVHHEIHVIDDQGAVVFSTTPVLNAQGDFSVDTSAPTSWPSIGPV